MRNVILSNVLLLSIAGSALAGEVQICTKLGPNDTPEKPATSFPAGTKHLYAVVKLEDNERFRTMTATWIAVDAEKAPDNTELANAEMDVRNVNKAVFEYEQPEAMGKGKYKLEIKVDGAEWKTIEFTVGR